MTDQEISLLTSCAGFAKGVLRMQTYPWQDKIFMDVDAPGFVALKSGNGCGKTTGVGVPIALWHLAAFRNSLTIATAATHRQISEQFMASIHSHAHRFQGWTFLDNEVRSHNGSRLYSFSTDSDTKFQGWHAPPDSSLLIIADESAGIADEIFESIMRCQPTRLLLLSSPGAPSGFFHSAFTSRRKFFKTHSVDAFACSHISQQWIQSQIELHGPDSPLVRSMVFAEWMVLGESGEIIPLLFIERLLADPPDFKDDGQIRAGADFAGGGDSNCLALRRGNRVEIAVCWKEFDTSKAIGKFVTLFRQHNLKPENIVADEGGMGLVFCDMLREAGWPVRRFNFGSPARDSEHFCNAGAELWFAARRRIEKREIILPRDNELTQQLCTRRGWPNSSGKLQLESKADLRGRGQVSPDKADAVLMTFSDYVKPGSWTKQILAGCRVGTIGPTDFQLTDRDILKPDDFVTAV